MKVTRYSYLLTLNDRKRHEHITEHGAVKQFAVQYETFIEGNWCPVIRYDTAHGFPQMDKSALMAPWRRSPCSLRTWERR